MAEGRIGLGRIARARGRGWGRLLLRGKRPFRVDVSFVVPVAVDFDVLQEVVVAVEELVAGRECAWEGCMNDHQYDETVGQERRRGRKDEETE